MTSSIIVSKTAGLLFVMHLVRGDVSCYRSGIACMLISCLISDFELIFQYDYSIDVLFLALIVYLMPAQRFSIISRNAIFNAFASG